jgi:hypothetical protein
LLVWTFFFFPELKGRSIESMDMLFNQSALTMRKRAYPVDESAKVLTPEAANKLLHGRGDLEKEIQVDQVENVK